MMTLCGLVLLRLLFDCYPPPKGRTDDQRTTSYFSLLLLRLRNKTRPFIERRRRGEWTTKQHTLCSTIHPVQCRVVPFVPWLFGLVLGVVWSQVPLSMPFRKHSTDRPSIRNPPPTFENPLFGVSFNSLASTHHNRSSSSSSLHDHHQQHHRIGRHTIKGGENDGDNCFPFWPPPQL